MSDLGPTVFSGRYELHRRIGRGGIAEVSLTRDQLLDRPVAIKALFPEFATDPSFVERFRREATAAANLSHPNVVGVYDWGEAEGTYYIVMEYIDGRTLSELLRDGGRLHPDRVADIGADVAAALGFAHRNGVVHRDVKPGNVLVDNNGLVKVADFGIARAISATSDDNLTQVGTVMGTATYFSPEQARGDAVDPRSDIYSLGCVLYELSVGRPPFSGDSPVGIAYKQVHEAPVPPRRINPDIPPALEAIILKCLAKNPVNRYPSAEDLRADLRRFREGNRILAEPVMAPPVVDPGATGVLPAATTAIPATGGQRRQPLRYEDDDYDDEPRRSSGAFIGVLVVLLLVLAGMLFLLAKTLGVGDGGDDTVLVEVPSVVGDPVDQARQSLEALGFEVDVTTEANDDEDEGNVFDQSPARGEKVPQDTVINLKVSAGAEAIPVPDLVGSTVAEATEIARQEGFTVRVESDPDADGPEDEVLRQDPVANAEAAKDSTIVLFVAGGPGEVEVRDVTGRTAAEASNLLGRDGFDVETSSEASTSVSEGRVIRTNPPAGSMATEGETITLVVSTGPPEPTTAQVPNVRGLSESNAVSALSARGFKNVEIQEQETAVPTEVGVVLEQTPTGGTHPTDTEVVIVVGVAPVLSDGDDGGE